MNDDIKNFQDNLKKRDYYEYTDISIFPTILTSNDDNSPYKDYIKVCNEVLPLNIETKYINLLYSIEEYLACKRILKGNDSNNAWMGLENQELIKKENIMLKEYCETKDKIKVISSKADYSDQDYDMMESLAKTAKNLKKEIRKTEIKINENRINGVENNISSSEFDIQKTVENIKKDLQEIRNLDLNGKSRLENLEITPKHIEEIESLDLKKYDGKFGTSEKEMKEHAKNLLISFLEIRKKAFKTVEELGYNILENYNKRNTDIPDELQEKYDVSLSALSVYNLNDLVPMNCFPGVNAFAGPYYDNLLTSSEVYINYMNDGEFTPELSKKATQFLHGYESGRLIDKITASDHKKQKYVI